MRNTMLAATAFAAFAAAPAAQAQEKIKFAVFTPDSEMTHQVVMKPFVAAVNKDSGGTIEIEDALKFLVAAYPQSSCLPIATPAEVYTELFRRKLIVRAGMDVDCCNRAAFRLTNLNYALELLADEPNLFSTISDD